MDNLSRIIAITLQPGQLSPCLLINKGVYTASTVYNTPFNVEVTLTYTSNGAHVGPIVSTQTISSTQFMQTIDAHTVRAKGQVIGLRSQPDAGTPIVLATRVLVSDATGTPVECCSASTASYTAPTPGSTSSAAPLHNDH